MSETEKVSDHSRVIMSGAWSGAAVGMSAVGWASMHMPHWCGYLMEWAVVLGVCYGLALYKKQWFGWAAFWFMAVLCPLAGILELTGVMAGQWSTASWVIACLLDTGYYWLIRMPRKRAAADPVRQEIHVFQHIIHHGAALPSAEVYAVTGTPPQQQVTAPVRRSITAPARAAIETGRKPARAAIETGRKIVAGISVTGKAQHPRDRQ